MKECSTPLDSVSFNTMIKACTRNADVAAAAHWFEEMQKAGIEPDLFTFNALIATATRAKDPLGAE
eukprot:9160215-Pyramimonas_sp.AAC.1